MSKPILFNTIKRIKFNTLTEEQKKKNWIIKEVDGTITTHIGSIDAEGGGTVIVDSEMSDTSTNAVQNRIITKALEGKATVYEVTPTVIEDKTYLTQEEIDYVTNNKPQFVIINIGNRVLPTTLAPNIEGQIIYYYNIGDQWSAFKIPQDATNEVITLDTRYQTKLTFDSTPTAGSYNPVTSSGIKSYVDVNAPYIVNMTMQDDNLVSDKTFGAIKQAIDNNKIVFVKYQVSQDNSSTIIVSEVEQKGTTYYISFASTSGSVISLQGAENDYPTITIDG